MVKAMSSVDDSRAAGGLVSNLPHPWVNKTKQHNTHTCKPLFTSSSAAPLRTASLTLLLNVERQSLSVAFPASQHDLSHVKTAHTN